MADEIAGIEGMGGIVDNGVAESNSGALGEFDALGRRVDADNRISNENAGGSNSDAGITATGESIDGIPVGKPTAGGDTADGDAPWGRKADGTPRAKPGRRPSGNPSRNAPAGKSSSKPSARASSVKGLEKILLSVHFIAAAKLEIPELSIDGGEAKMLADAVNAVQEHYGFDVPAEVAIWVNLVMALGTVYGPRAVAIHTRKKRERKNKPERAKTQPDQSMQSDVVQIPGMHAPLQ